MPDTVAPIATGGGFGTGYTGATIDPSQSTLSPNFGQYVYNMLGRGEAAANLPFQPFEGERFAGPSALQTQGFQGISSLASNTPSQFGTATDLASRAGQAAGTTSYTPTAFNPIGIGHLTTTSEYQAPGAYQPSSFQNRFQAPSDYQATTATSGYQAPAPYQAANFTPGFNFGVGTATQFTNPFQAPGAYQTGTFNSGYNAPQAYQPATDFTQGIGSLSYQTGVFNPGFNYQAGQINTGLGPVGSIESYMSPYQSAVSDIEAREARRQADISAAARGSKYAQAGAFGGSRQAIENAEADKNLSTLLGDIRAKGLQGAYDRALAQRLQESQLGMTAQEATERARQFGAERAAQFGLEAQKAGEASRQFGAQYGLQGLGQLLQARQAQEQSRQFGATQAARSAEFGAQQQLEAQRAAEASRQFGAQQGMTAAQLQAQFGMDTQKAQEAARQFGEGQRLNAAQLQAQFGLDAQKAAELSRQFGAQQAMTGAETASRLGLQAQQLTAQDRQFGAQQQMQARQLQAQFGLSADQAAEAARQFAYGQQMTAAQLQAQFGLDAQKANQLANLQAQQANQRAGMEAQQLSEQSRQFGARLGLEGLQQQINAAQALGGLGTQQFGTQLQGLDALMRAGATQQQFMQQPLDFGYQQFQESMKYPYQQATFMQSLLQGLPLQARAYDTGQSEWMAALQGGLSSLALQQALLGK